MGGHENRRLSELGEDEVVARLISSLPADSSVVVGAGDDCAVIDTGADEWQLLKTDCLIEGVHFVAGSTPVEVGRKAISRVVSDVAAMGGTPGHALVTLVTDGDRSIEEVEGWYQGINDAAREFCCLVVGGETARLEKTGAMLSIAMTGSVSRDHCVTRSGASTGDIILVTGRLGGSFNSGRHLKFMPRLEEAQWLVRNFRPTAMMDLSDGLGSDLPRLAKASGVGFHLDLEEIPRHEGVALEAAICDGEDYELLMTVTESVWGKLRDRWNDQFPGVALTRIGTITAEEESLPGSGWDHFRKDG